MKFLKYAVLSLLIITVCKKITPQSKSSTQKEKKKSLSSNIKKYDDSRKLATVAGTTFVGVYEHDPVVNPVSPAQRIPAMLPFGTIHSKTNQSSDKFQHKFKNATALHGIPVDGHRKPIRKVHTNKVLGYVWQDQDKVKDQVYGLGIAQLDAGDTYVGVKAVHLPNYIENHKNPHYNPDEQELLAHRYGIMQINPTLLGTAKLGSMRYSGPYKRQTYMIYGVQLPDLKQLDTKNTRELLFNKQTLASYPIIAYHAIQKYLESKKNKSDQQANSSQPVSYRTAASTLYNPLI